MNDPVLRTPVNILDEVNTNLLKSVLLETLDSVEILVLLLRSKPLLLPILLLCFPGIDIGRPVHNLYREHPG